MAGLSLKNIMKIYPHSGDQKKSKKKKGEPEKKTNLQVTEEGVVAVQKFNLDIADKEFIVLVGPSGCGKSTTLRMVAGLEEISGGELYIDGKLMNDVEPKNRDIAMVFQSYALYPHMTVYENMAFPLKLRKVDKAEIDRRVKEAAETLDITQYLDRKPKALSGGQRQRVAIGRAIVREPKVLLMDEPLSNLDAKLRISLRSELKRLQRDLKITTLYVTHDQDEAMNLSDRIAVFNNGYIEQVGTPYDIYNHSRSEFVCDFIGDINRLEAAMLSDINRQTGASLKENLTGFIRIERVLSLEKPHTARLKGTVEDLEYNGMLAKYTVHACGQTIKIVEKNDGREFFGQGQRIDFFVNPDDIMQYGEGQS